MERFKDSFNDNAISELVKKVSEITGDKDIKDKISFLKSSYLICYAYVINNSNNALSNFSFSDRILPRVVNIVCFAVSFIINTDNIFWRNGEDSVFSSMPCFSCSVYAKSNTLF